MEKKSAQKRVYEKATCGESFDYAQDKQGRTIKNWPKEDRPREKLFKSGEHTLSNTELIAILLRSGVKGQSAIDLARKILSKFSTFRNMSHTDARDWKEIKGLGQANVLDSQVVAGMLKETGYKNGRRPYFKKLSTRKFA